MTSLEARLERMRTGAPRTTAQSTTGSTVQSGGSKGTLEQRLERMRQDGLAQAAANRAGAGGSPALNTMNSYQYSGGATLPGLTPREMMRGATPEAAVRLPQALGNGANPAPTAQGAAGPSPTVSQAPGQTASGLLEQEQDPFDRWEAQQEAQKKLLEQEQDLIKQVNQAKSTLYGFQRIERHKRVGTQAQIEEAQAQLDEAEAGLEAVREQLRGLGVEDYSVKKSVSSLIQKGLSGIASAGGSAVRLAEDLLSVPFDIVSGQPLGSTFENGPMHQWDRSIKAGQQAIGEKYQKNMERGGKAAELLEEYGAATIQALPNALLAVLTAGGSVAAQTTAGLTQMANAALSPSVAATVSASIANMAQNPMYWASFAQVVGPSYDQALYDGASVDKAALYAVGNGLLNAAVEIGGGLETLPEVLQGGVSAWRAWVDGMMDEGKEEVVQGAIERALQAIYGKNNPVLSFDQKDEDAILNPYTAGKEFAGGAVVGGILSGGEIGTNAALNAVYNAAANRADTRSSRAVEPSGAQAALDYSATGQEALDRPSVEPSGADVQNGANPAPTAQDAAGPSPTVPQSASDGSTARLAAEQSAAGTGSAREYHGDILDTVRANLDAVQKMQPVAELSGTEFQKSSKDTRPLSKKILDFFNSLGNKITRSDIGEITLNSAGVRDSISHGIGKLKAATFASLPSVLTDGQIIARKGPYEGHEYNSIVISAPVTVNGTTCYVGALVIQDEKTQRYKLHEVLTTSENGVPLFKTESGEDAGPLRSGTPLEGSEDASDQSIPQQAGEGNTQNNVPELGTETERTEIHEPQAGAEAAETAAATAGAEVRDGLSGGGEERVPGQSAGGEAVRFPDRAETARQAAEQRGTAAERQALAKDLRLEKTSAQALGVVDGSTQNNLTVVPEGIDPRLDALRQRIRQETGQNTTFVLGPVGVYTKDGGYSTVKDVVTANGFIIQADHYMYGPEQIYLHVQFHDLVSLDPTIRAEAKQQIKEQFPENDLDQILNTYMRVYGPLYGLTEHTTIDELNALIDDVEEEYLADIYAGINAFGIDNAKYRKTVKETVERKPINPVDLLRGDRGQRYSVENTGDAEADAALDRGEGSRYDERETIEQEDGYGRAKEEAAAGEGIPGNVLREEAQRPANSDAGGAGGVRTEAARDRRVGKVASWADGRLTEPKTKAAGAALEAAREYGASAYTVEDVAIKERRDTAWALTQGGVIYLSDSIPEGLGDVIGYHELVHAAKQNGNRAYLDFLDGTFQRLDHQTQGAADLLDLLADMREPGSSFMELDEKQGETALDELNALVWGYYKADPENARKQFSAAFLDYDGYIRDLDSAVSEGVRNEEERKPINPVDLLRGDRGQRYSVENTGDAEADTRSEEGRRRDELTDKAFGFRHVETVEEAPTPSAAPSDADGAGADYSATGQEALGGSSVAPSDADVRNGANPAPTAEDAAGPSPTVPQSASDGAAGRKKGGVAAESRPTIAKKDLRQNMLNLFSIPAGQRAEAGQIIDSAAERIVREGKLTQADRDALFDRLYESGVMELAADEYLQIGRDAVKGRRVYVDEKTAHEFADDWNSFRKRAFANGIYLTSDTNDAHLDAWNGELADSLPGLFDAQDLDDRSILERIVQVAEEGKAEKLSLPEYAARLAGLEGVSESELLDSMERQMDYQLRTFAEKAGLEIALKDRQAAREARDRNRRMEAAARQQETRALRTLQQGTLKELQRLKKLRNKASAEYKAKIDSILGDIDVYAVSAAKLMRYSNAYGATWQDLAEMYRDASNPDSPNYSPAVKFNKDLEKIFKRVEGVKLGSMDVSDLKNLLDAATGLRTSIEASHRLLANARENDIRQVAMDSEREIKASKGDKSVNYLRTYADSLLTPMNRLRQLVGWHQGTALGSMAEELEEGERQKKDYIVRAHRILADCLTENKDWVRRSDGQGRNGEWIDIQVPTVAIRGKGDAPLGDMTTLSITPAMRVHLYLESQNEDNLRHMEVGGRTFADKELYRKGKRSAAFQAGTTVKLTPAMIEAITADMTPQEQAMAQALSKYYNEFAKDRINGVSNAYLGFDRAIAGFYAPMRTNLNYNVIEPGLYDITVEGVGAMKERQPGAVAPTLMMGAYDAFERHVDATARWTGLVMPIRDFNMLYNWQSRGESFKDVISHQWGEPAVDFLDKLVTELNGGKLKEDKGIADNFADTALSRYIGSVFGANFGVVAKQAASFPLAGTYLGWTTMPNVAAALKTSDELINTYTSELAYRQLGYSTPETAQLKNNPSRLSENKVYKFALGGGAITAMDGATVKTIWRWAENAVRKDNPNLDVGTREEIDAGHSPFYQEVARRFEEAVSNSQPMYDTMHRAGVMRYSGKGSGLTKSVTMFHTVLIQQYNMLVQTANEAKAAKADYDAKRLSREEYVQAKKKAGRAVTGVIMAGLGIETLNLLVAALTNRWDRYEDDDGERTAQSILTQVAKGFVGDNLGMLPGGDLIYEVLGSMATRDRWYGIEAPGVTQIEDILEDLIKNGQGALDVITGVVDVVKNGGDGMAYLRRHENDYLGAIKSVAKTAGTYIGAFPADNLEKYLLGMVSNVFPQAKTAYEDFFATADKSGLKGLTGDALEVRMGDILKNRLGEADEEAVAALSALYEAGYAGAAPGDTPKSFAVNGEERELSPFQKQFYDQVWRDVVGEQLGELVRSEEFRAASPESQEKQLKKLYSYGQERAKAELFEDYEGTSAVEKFMAGGLDQEDAVSAALAVDRLEPEKGKTSVSETQKALAVAGMDLSAKDTDAAVGALLSESAMSDYEAAREAGLDPEVYLTWKLQLAWYQNTETATRKEQVVESIDELGISKKQKDALFLTQYSEKGLGETPWH